MVVLIDINRFCACLLEAGVPFIPILSYNMSVKTDYESKILRRR